MKLFLLACFFSLSLSANFNSNGNDISKDTLIQKLIERVNSLETEMPKMKKRLQKCEMGLQNMSASKSSNEKEYRRFLQDGVLDVGSDSTRVSFYAHLSKNVAGIGVHHPIVFDTVRYNDGNAYNKVDGEFTAKIPGTYFFIWTISARDRTYMETELVVNGVVFGHVIGDAADHDDWGVGTGFVIVRLNVNDTVWIRSGPVNNGQLTGEGLGTSSFGGYLLYQ